MSDLLTSHQVADLAGISERKARQALARGAEGHLWRGSRLRVVVTHGSGGCSGRQFRADPTSLPHDLYAAWKALQPDAKRPLKLDDTSAEWRRWKANLLAPLIEHERRTPEHREAKKAILARPVCYPCGTWKHVPKDTLYKWEARYRLEGFAGLTRSERRGAREKLTFVSRAWDKAVTCDDAVKAKVGAELRGVIRLLRSKEEAPSQIRLICRAWLMRRTREIGFGGSDADLHAACAIPYNLVWAEKDFRKVGRLRTDAKAYADARPRIARSPHGLRPMDVVVGDVHPIDIYYRRPDGSTATPKLIAWLDIATGRLWTTVVFLEKGRAITARHVVASFIDMATAWGMPKGLYLDNGSEYDWSEFIADALSLVGKMGEALGEIAPWSARRSNVINALPYNAPAKPIEGIFGLLERLYFRRILGWVAGNRLKKKSANLGREPDPYPGTCDELRDAIGQCIAWYNASPQERSTYLKGKSPNGAFQAAIDAGWTAIMPDRDTLRIAFAIEKELQVRQGVVSYKGQRYTCPELHAYQGDRVTLKLPKFEDWTRLPLLDEQGRLLGFAAPDVAYAFLDPAGAVESHARAKRHRDGVLKLEKQVPKLDVAKLHSDTVKSLAAPPTIVPGGLLEHVKSEDRKLLKGFDGQPDDSQSAAEREAAFKRRMAEVSALIFSKPARPW